KDPIDNECSVMKIDAEDGKTIATLINYGCHPEVLWSENLLLTSDYVGYLNEEIENNFSGISFFFNENFYISVNKKRKYGYGIDRTRIDPSCKARRSGSSG
ncbi:MAG: hypothetical protein ONB13_05185, partial [candidate division KSB1 bacterium]|nr:hypothetical protein [candidate division KSB1 bacterium]